MVMGIFADLKLSVFWPKLILFIFQEFGNEGAASVLHHFSVWIFGSHHLFKLLLPSRQFMLSAIFNHLWNPLAWTDNTRSISCYPMGSTFFVVVASIFVFVQMFSQSLIIPSSFFFFFMIIYQYITFICIPI